MSDWLIEKKERQKKRKKERKGGESMCHWVHLIKRYGLRCMLSDCWPKILIKVYCFWKTGESKT